MPLWDTLYDEKAHGRDSFRSKPETGLVLVGEVIFVVCFSVLAKDTGSDRSPLTGGDH